MFDSVDTLKELILLFFSGFCCCDSH